jgi:hypothetical protein
MFRTERLFTSQIEELTRESHHADRLARRSSQLQQSHSFSHFGCVRGRPPTHAGHLAPRGRGRSGEEGEQRPYPGAIGGGVRIGQAELVGTQRVEADERMTCSARGAKVGARDRRADHLVAAPIAAGAAGSMLR